MLSLSTASDILLDGLELLCASSSRLDSELGTSPMLLELVESVVVVLLDGTTELLELRSVFLIDIHHSDGGGSLLSDEKSESGLALDDGVWHAHLSAEGREPDDDLNGINIMGDHNELRLFLLNQSGDVVDTILHVVWLLGAFGRGGGGGRGLSLGSLSLLGSLLGNSEQALLLRGSVLGSVLSQELEKNGGSVLIESLGELVDCRGNLQSVQQDALLSLESNVLRPLHESGQVALGWQIISDTKVSGSLLEKRVLGWGGNGLSGSLLGVIRGSSHLLAGSFLGSLGHGAMRKRNQQRTPCK